MSALPALSPPAANPWLGLASFTEDNRADFFGREEEVAELSRRVQRRLVTVLFGKSGLGKTSLVRAGLTPRLRAQGGCPIPIRIRYSLDIPDPSRQIRQAILESGGPGAAAFLGDAPENLSPWELLHRRGASLRDAGGAPQMPLLIFDQFEEIFTLAQSDEAGRARAARFLTDLADLAENRPPVALEARLEQDESLAEAFDFTRSDYRVLIVLREDYLAALESLTKAMPSLAENRLRLAPMTGTQALQAVEGPGRGLVTPEVAAAIVRFVAGDSELAHAEVEPSLLSLICRELNDARVSQGRGEISLDLLAGSHTTILSNFYERALAGQPAAVRSLIEDALLTSSGYRESVAEEDLQARFIAASAAPDALTTLVDRRLLRIEERLDARRVELTHDVLGPVVKESRDRRREREAREATERLLKEQREREAAARRSLRRARWVALGCTVLALVALAAAVAAYLAERDARQTRTIANQARVQAERLLEYLSDDFARELESEGRSDVVAALSKRQIDYFRALPVVLHDPVTVRNGALALAHHAGAQRRLGDMKSADADAQEASGLLQGLFDQGDRSEATVTALSRSLLEQSLTRLSQLDVQTSESLLQRAAALLQPRSEAPGASAAVRAAYVEVLQNQGNVRMVRGDQQGVIPFEQHARQLAQTLGALDASDPEMAVEYVGSSALLVYALSALDRTEEGHRTGEEAFQVAEKVIQRRPGSRAALTAALALGDSLVSIDNLELQPERAVHHSLRNEQLSLMVLGMDPRNVQSQSNESLIALKVATSLWRAGRLQEAVPYLQRHLQYADQAAQGSTVSLITAVFNPLDVADRLIAVGDLPGARAVMVGGRRLREQLRHDPAAGPVGPLTAGCVEELGEAQVELGEADLERALQHVKEGRRVLDAAASSQDSGIQRVREVCLAFAAYLEGSAQYRLGHFSAAEQSWRDALARRQRLVGGSADDRRTLAGHSLWLALSVARQGRRDQAATLITPVVSLLRELSSRNHGDCWLPLELASALYAQALAEPPHREALLKEAQTLVDGLLPSLRFLRDVREWKSRILEAQQNASL